LVFGVANLGQLLEQLGQHPQQEGGVQAREFISLSAVRDVDNAFTYPPSAHEVVDQHRLAKNLSAPWLSVAAGRAEWRPRWLLTLP
jgi:hypothetical protein